MSVYLIAYDLKQATSKDYQDIHAKIQSYGSSVHILESTWLVDTSFSANSIVQGLRSVYSKENCFAIQLQRGTDYEGWIPENHWTWINSRLR